MTDNKYFPLEPIPECIMVPVKMTVIGLTVTVALPIMRSPSPKLVKDLKSAKALICSGTAVCLSTTSNEIQKFFTTFFAGIDKGAAIATLTNYVMHTAKLWDMYDPEIHTYPTHISVPIRSAWYTAQEKQFK